MSAAEGASSFTFEMTAKDNAQAAALIAGRHPLRRVGPLLIVALSLILGGLLALATARLSPDGDARRAFGLGAAATALFLGFQYLLLLRIALNTTQRSIESLGWTGRAVEGVIDQAGITFEGTLRLDWSNLRRVIEGPAHIVLLSGDLAPIALPKRALGEEARNLLPAAPLPA